LRPSKDDCTVTSESEVNVANGGFELSRGDGRALLRVGLRDGISDATPALGVLMSARFTRATRDTV
jgi:hypothetical protein